MRCSKASIILSTLLILNPSIIWSNSRLPWRSSTTKSFKNPRNQSMNLQNKIEQWNKVVSAYLESKQPDKALAFLKETLRLDAGNHYSIGMTAYLLLVYKKDYQAAKEMAQNGLNRHPQSIYCLHTLAWLHYLEKEFGLAYRVIQEIKETEFSWFDLQLHWAMISWKAHKRSDAQKHFSIARQIKPNHAPLWISMGMFLEEEKKIKPAVNAYQEALKLVDNQAPVRTYLISKIDELLPLYVSRDKLPDKFIGIEATTQNYSKLFNKNKASKIPVNLSNKVIHQSISEKSNQNDEVNKLGRVKAIQASPLSEELQKQTSDESNDTQQNPFLKPLQGNIDSFQEDNHALEQISIEQHFQVGQDLLSYKIREEAISQFQTVINLWGNSDYTVAATTSLNQAKRLGFQTLDTRLDRLFEYGEQLFQQERLKECLYIQRKILLLSPNHSRALKNASFIYLKFQRPITAIQLLDQTLNISPNFVEAKVLKAYALAMLRRFNSAATILSEVMSSPDQGFNQDYAKQLQTTINQFQKPLNQ